MDLVIGKTIGLLVVAILVAIAARRLRLPAASEQAKQWMPVRGVMAEWLSEFNFSASCETVGAPTPKL
jgi:hypothetical protein